MEIDNRTEAAMSAITTPAPQVTYSPSAAFATTRAGAERRARAAAAEASRTTSQLRRLIDRLVSPHA
jgi:hypothetical protein